MALSHNDTKAFFNRIPWCSTLLAKPSTTILHPPSRTPKKHTNEDALFAETLQTSRTITAALALHPHPAPTAETIDSLSVLLALGDGLDGWPQVLHGGIVATILDEVIGTLLVINADYKRVRAEAAGHEKKAGGGVAEAVGAYTAELKVRYLAPVATPGVVLVETRIKRREGRKIWMEARILQKNEKKKSGREEEDDEGLVGDMLECSVGEALMIVHRGTKL